MITTFYGRVSTEDWQDLVTSRARQRDQAAALVAGHGRIVAEFFDTGYSRTLAWARRPQAAALVAALADPDRGWDAIVIGEYERAFCLLWLNRSRIGRVAARPDRHRCGAGGGAARLYELLVRIACGEAGRRAPRLRISGPELDDLADQAAPDALLAITAKIGQFQGESRFTTWAYKFVIFEVSAKIGRHFGGTRACGWTPRTGSGCRTGSVWAPPRSRSGGICSPHQPSYCPVASRGMTGFRDHPPGSRPLDRSRDLNGEAPAGRHEDRAVRPALAGWAGRGRPRHHRPDGPGWRLFAARAI